MKINTELIAAAIADVEGLTEDVDVDGIGASTLRLAVNQIGAQIKKEHPRFNVAEFEATALPRQSERQKRAILKTLGFADAS